MTLPPSDAPDDVKSDKPDRLHGRHVLNRYEDGMEKCIGCELCAGVCPAKCIYVRGKDNDAEAPTSPGERFGFVYEINYLRCIHCDLCVEACPTEAITESKMFEFSFTNRRTRSTPRPSCSSATTASRSTCRGRTGAHGEDAHDERLGAGHGAVRRRRLRRPRRLERRARLRRAGTGGTVGVIDVIVFVIASGMVLGGAFGVVLYRHPVHAALSLVLTLFGVAVHFVSMEAHFLAAVQVIVYAGAIVVLFLFVIMLLGVDKAEELRVEPLPIQRPLAAVMGLGIVGLLIAAIVSTHDTQAARRSAPGSTSPARSNEAGDAGADRHDANIRQLADNLFSDHVFAFELTSVLLIVAVAGTVVLTRREKRARRRR